MEKKRKGPKTMVGTLRREWTGDGRKKLSTSICEEMWGKKKKKK